MADTTERPIALQIEKILECDGMASSGIVKASIWRDYAVTLAKSVQASDVVKLQAEVARMRAGQFTKDEIHNFCHDLHGTVCAVGFAEGCEAEQRKFYGKAPHADRVKELEAEVARLKASYVAVPYSSREDTELRGPQLSNAHGTISIQDGYAVATVGGRAIERMALPADFDESRAFIMRHLHGGDPGGALGVTARSYVNEYMMKPKDPTT